MEDLLKTFHIEAGLLLAQFINFAIVFAVLYKFAYNPALKLLKERTRKIEKGLKDAEESHKKLQEISEKEAAVLVEARKKAQEIIKKSEESAVAQSQEIIVAAKKQTDDMLESAKKEIEHEKERIIAEAKSEVADLVVLATEKIIGEKLDNVKDKELINQAIK